MRAAACRAPALAASLAALLAAPRAAAYDNNAANLKAIQSAIRATNSLLARAGSGSKAIPQARLREMRDFISLAEEIEPWVERLVRAEERYPDASSPDELEAERSEPRKQLISSVPRFKKRWNSIAARADTDYYRTTPFFSSDPRTRVPQQLILQEIYFTARELSGGSGPNDMLYWDEQLHEPARKKLERRLLRKRLAMFAAFLLPALAWAARRRRGRDDWNAAGMKRLRLAGSLLGLAGCVFLLRRSLRAPGLLEAGPNTILSDTRRILSLARSDLPRMRRDFDAIRTSRVRMDPAIRKIMGEIVESLEDLTQIESRLTELEPGYFRLDGARDLERVQLRRRIEDVRPKFQKRCIAYRRLYPNAYAHLLFLGTSGHGNSNGASSAANGIRDFDAIWPNSHWAVSDFLNQDGEVYERSKPARLIEEIRLDLLLPFSAAGLLTFGFAAFLNRRAFAEPAAGSCSTDAVPGAKTATGTAAPGGAPSGPALIGGNFRITRELGRGGMGLVYEVLDLTLQRKVAVKQMREELCQSPEELRMFLDEARLVAALKHPNIVEIHGVLREKGQVYLLFEYVPGKTLSQELAERGRLPLREALGLLKPAAEAVDYAHSRRIIHRDLKPSNIMLTEKREVKVMDFGLAHQAKVTVARLTKAAAWGTMAYMAPEQELGAVSKESDIFSLGVCLYEAATGRLPFPGPDYLSQKRERRYAAPSASGLAPELDAALARALAPEPAERFHSAAELLAAVESCSADAVPGAKTATGAAEASAAKEAGA